MSIENRYEFVFLFDVLDGNPNGDPDAGNLPRVDPETGHGLVTDVCLKRKIRNYVQFAKNNESGFNIYVIEKAILTNQRKQAHNSLGIQYSSKSDSDIKKARNWMCENFYDIRTFGAVMAFSECNCGQVRGPVQLTFARSIEPVMINEYAITRMAVETEKESDNQSGENKTMGRKNTISYGLYREHGFINPFYADKTGFSDNDLSLFWDALKNMFDLDRTAARGTITPRKLIVFKHDSKLGNANAYTLFDKVKILKKDEAKASRSFDDYDVIVDDTPIAGIEIINMI